VKTLALVLVLVAVALAGCEKKPKPTKQKPVAGLTDVELKRGEDACKLYVDKICACAQTKPDLAQQCQLAKALPEAMQIALSVATHPDSKPDVAQQSYDSVRRTMGECIQETAKLPSLGCN
jgi:hypothetical protein